MGSFSSLQQQKHYSSRKHQIISYAQDKSSLVQPKKHRKPGQARKYISVFTLGTIHMPLTNGEINQGCNPWVRLTLECPKLLYLVEVTMCVGVCLYTAIA